MKYIIYTNPVQFTTDYNHANVIADEHFEKTREIVAIEEVHRLCQFPSQILIITKQIILWSLQNEESIRPNKTVSL